MSKHTPGPWHAVSHYCDSITVVDSGGFSHVSASHTAVLLDYSAKLGICHWADSPDASRELSEEEQAANARLIAAAPDLLDALQVAELALRERGLRACGEYKQIEAAIAKATGK